MLSTKKKNEILWLAESNREPHKVLHSKIMLSDFFHRLSVALRPEKP